MRFDADTRFECGELEAIVIVAEVSWFNRKSTSQGGVRFQQVRGGGYQGRGLAMRRRRRGSPGQENSPIRESGSGPLPASDAYASATSHHLQQRITWECPTTELQALLPPPTPRAY
jgi:hypothetical protein